MNDAGDGDDQEADDDGGDRHVERHPAQPPGAVVVSLRVAVPGLGARRHRRKSVLTFRRGTLSEVSINPAVQCRGKYGKPFFFLWAWSLQTRLQRG